MKMYLTFNLTTITVLVKQSMNKSYSDHHKNVTLFQTHNLLFNF